MGVGDRFDRGGEMTLSSEIKTVLQANAPLMAILTGGIFCDVEEISRQNTAAAFDTNREIKPSALIKLGVETKRGPFLRSVQTPLTIYFYERQGYANIASAMVMAYNLLNDAQVGTGVWELTYDVSVSQQRDTALDCALGSLRFVAVRLR